jgi:hypothetical protein
VEPEDQNVEPWSQDEPTGSAAPLSPSLLTSPSQVRDSVKNIAIEKGLSHAAHKGGGGFLKLKSSSGIQKKARPSQPAPSCSYKMEMDFSKDRHRAKKVGNTAKQRLGKILGLKF